MSKFHCNLPDLRWPPQSDDEMLEWQRAVGTDLEIARLLGLSRASIYGQRIKFGVPSVARKKRTRVCECRLERQSNKIAIARLYAGRRYEDWGQGLSRRSQVKPTGMFWTEQ
ncbi:MAG: hypothetical protein CL573_08485 [Alphaproteobacteria bacterium]|nr:hypothetical protein [Alphaproteobacteria bacterium]HCP01635.1 hypothetical protein [Rhodospirillaceae bacterium]